MPALLCPLVLATSCVDGTRPTGVALETVALTLLPELNGPAAVNIAAPINRLRVTVRVASTGARLLELEEDVDPGAAEWEVTLQTPVPREGAEAMVLVELLNVTDGVEAVIWSGQIGPLSLTPGRSLEASEVTLYPGPPANLAVTSVHVTPDSATVREGDTLRLVAAMETTDPDATPVPYWYALGAAAGVDSTGLVLGLAAGETRIVAQAGPPADTVVVFVQAVPAPGFYDAPGNTQLVLGAYPDVPATPHATNPAGLLEGKPTLTAVADTLPTSMGGTVVVEADGSALYTPPPGTTGATDAFHYRVTTGDSARVEVTLGRLVWYVDQQNGSFLNPGTSDRPVAAWLDLSDVRAPGDVAHMAPGTYLGSIQLVNDQELVGAGSPLVLAGFGTLAPASSAPVLHDPGTVVTMSGDRSVLRGVVIAQDPGSGAAFSHGVAVLGASDVTIDDVRVLEPTERGVLLRDLGGASTVTGLEVSRTTPGFGGIGLEVFGGTGRIDVDATVDVLDAILVQVDSTLAGSSVVLGGTYTALQGDTTVRIVDVAGDVSFDRVSVGTGSGFGVALDRLTGSVDFALLEISGAVNIGVIASGLDGVLDIADGLIDVDGTAAFQVGGGSGDVVYGGAIQISRGASVRISDKTGGSVTFSGPVTDAGAGILLQNNPGATTTFSGDLLLTTAQGANAFTALNGGTVEVTGADNVVAATVGRAVDLSGGTVIGPNGVRFRSVSADAPDVGINLWDTGSGLFAVTGDGTAGSGGTISQADSAGVMVRDAARARVSGMVIDQARVAGIYGFAERQGAAFDLEVDATVVQDATLLGSNGVLALALDGTSADLSVSGSMVRDYMNVLVVQSGTQQGASANVRIFDTDLVGNVQVPGTAVGALVAEGLSLCADLQNVRTTRNQAPVDWLLSGGQQGVVNLVGFQTDVLATLVERGVLGRLFEQDPLGAPTLSAPGPFGACTP